MSVCGLSSFFALTSRTFGVQARTFRASCCSKEKQYGTAVMKGNESGYEIR